MKIDVFVADKSHLKYAQTICDEIEKAAYLRGTGIAKRKPEYIESKINDGKAVIALTEDGRFAGFSYIETWEHEKYVATSGLIVVPEFRMSGLAKRIKQGTFFLERKRFPSAKIFSITTSLPVMKLNTEIGYKPVTFSELTSDETFWNGCQAASTLTCCHATTAGCAYALACCTTRQYLMTNPYWKISLYLTAV